jgi:hypothetical protein
LAKGSHGVRFLLFGLSATVLQEANSSTRDIDLWFADERRVEGYLRRRVRPESY